MGLSLGHFKDALAAAPSLGSDGGDGWCHLVRLTHMAAGLAGLRVLGGGRHLPSPSPQHKGGSCIHPAAQVGKPRLREARSLARKPGAWGRTRSPWGGRVRWPARLLNPCPSCSPPHPQEWQPHSCRRPKLASFTGTIELPPRAPNKSHHGAIPDSAAWNSGNEPHVQPREKAKTQRGHRREFTRCSKYDFAVLGTWENAHNLSEVGKST